MSERPLHRIPLAVITGPTATGKTGLGLELARRFDAEVISADSMQVYRRLDVGTAKPTAEERASVPHHLLDVADPDEAFDTVRFQELADAAIAGIHAAGRRVLVVGGTGLYLRILLWGLADVPGPDPERRRRLEAEAEAWGNISLHSRLADLDPAAARRIHVSDRFRLIRALEVIETTGRPISELQDAHRFSRPRYPHRIVALDLPREVLRERILRRAEAMLGAGLLDEVRGLLRDGYAPDLRPLRGFGYREPVRCVMGERPEEGLAEAIARDTARYAKRQRTWLRSERGVEWIAPDAWEAARRFGPLWEPGTGERPTEE